MRADEDGAPELVLGPMLRWVDETRATIWVETSAPCEVEILGCRARTFRVGRRFYALVVVSGLEAGSTTPYEVMLDGRGVWPQADSDAPPSLIRTEGSHRPARILIGSCRAAAPHRAPYTKALAMNPEGRGVDTLWSHARRMMRNDVDLWPTLVVFAGDQIYADDSSPEARKRIEARRSESLDLEASKVHDLEEYCWLYQEAWSSHSERWLLSTVPSAMIFDDHDMIDDWNISESWLADMDDDPTWRERAIHGYMTYWIHQHLGNLSPEQIEEEGLLARLLDVEDGTEILRDWAIRCLDGAGTPGGEQFSHVRHVGDVTVVTVDCRNGRILHDGRRLMVQESEWERITEAAMESEGDLVFVTSLPLYLSNGIHDLHTWSSRLCAGAWGRPGRRLGERVRRGLDLEDWPAFPESYAAFDDLIATLRRRDTPPRSIVVASGDIHFSYAARVGHFEGSPGPQVWQIVSSPIRNALIPHERSAMRFSTTRTGGLVGSVLRRAVRGPDTRPRIDLVEGPFFANNMCELSYADGGITAVFENSTSIDDGDEPDLTEVGRVVIERGGRGGTPAASPSIASS